MQGSKRVFKKLPLLRNTTHLQKTGKKEFNNINWRCQSTAFTKFGKPENKVYTTKKLADIAGVSKETYRMGAKVINSNNEDVKQRVLSGET